MGDLDFEELDKAINELYESLDDDLDDGGNNGGDSNSDNNQASQPVPATRPDEVSASSREGNPEPSSEAAQKHHTPHRRRIADIEVPGQRANSVAADQMTEDPTMADAPASVDGATTGHGHFMDMIHPSSDTQVQHKANFAAERQAELDVKLAEETEVAGDDAPDDSREVKPAKIVVAVDDVDERADDDVNDHKSLAEAKPIAVTESTDNAGAVPAAEADKAEPAKEAEPAAEHEAVMTHKAGRRSVQYSNANRRTKHDLAQPLPTSAAALGVAAAADVTAAAKEPYEAPFLPDAKVTKRPLGAMPSPPKHDNVAAEKTAEQKSGAETDKHEPTNIDESGRHETTDTAKRLNRRSVNQGRSGRRRLSDDQPVATRQSVAANRELTVRSSRDRVIRVIGRILLFVAIIIIGALTGMAFYYYGG